MKKTFKATLIATVIATLPFGASAAGLGAINVFSGLGQPLRAEIELNATPQELQSLTARVAGPEAFRQANFSFSPVLSGVRMTVERRGERAFLRVSSDRPVTDPFLDLVVEVNWAAGRVLREYTFLLDPVDVRRPEAPVQAAAPVRQPIATAPAAPARASSSVPANLPSRYEVARGDTLRGIANRFRQPDTNLDQMLVALLRENPDAFDGGNMNRLRAGAILSIPSAADVQSIQPAAARREIVAQAADFEAYRDRVAGRVVAREAADQPASRESAGEIVPRVAEPAPAAVSDRVEVSGSADAPGGTVDQQRLARLEALEEELVAREKMLIEANERLAELEAVVRDLQRLVELRNQSLAQLQQAAQPAQGQAPEATPEAAPAEPVMAPVASEQTAPEETVAVEPETAVPDGEEALPDLAAELEAAAAQVEQDGVAAAPAEPPAAVTEAPAAPVVPAEPAVAPPVPAAPVPAPVAEQPVERPAPPPAPAPQPSFLQTLLDDPMMLAAGGGIAALLLGLGVLTMRRKRKVAEAEGEPLSMLTEDQTGAHSVFGAKGGQTVDTGASSVLHTDFSQSGLSAIDADEGVDPVAEADVYMAYGRDAQAEEILLDALKADPSRAAIYLKLLEVYASRPDLKQFEAIATDFYSRTGGSGDEWRKAAETGRRIDPNNPLYAERANSDQDEPPITETSRGPQSDFGSAFGMTTAAASAAAAAVSVEAASSTPDGHSKPAALPDSDAGPVAHDPVENDQPAEISLADLDFTSSQSVEPSPSQLKATWTVPGELRQLSGAAEPEPAPQEDLAPALPELEDLASDEKPDLSVLDFEFDDDEGAAGKDVSEGSTGSDADEIPAAAESSAPDDGLTLDLDALDDVLEDASSSPEQKDADISMDKTMLATSFDLDGDLDSFGASSTPSGPADTAASVGRGTAAQDPSMQATVIQGVELPEEDSAEMDLEKTGFDNSLLDFDFDLESSHPEPVSEVKPLDLSSIDLDLELPDAPPPVEDDPLLPSASQEVDTKLDLARAYEEMGDKDGARELVEEVLREGSPDQVERAKALLAQLG